MLEPANALEARSVVLIDAVIEDFLTDKGKGQRGESGNYREDASRELDRFVDFLAKHEDSPTSFDELDSGYLREYARHLTRQGWTAGTVRTYYAYVSAFCGWAVREGHLAENVAQRRNATEPIPDSGGHKSGDQQAWSAEDRQQLTTFVDEQAGTAIDDVGENREAAIKACRDRALVYLLSYSGVRGAEILRDRSDERRQGLRWENVHPEDRYATVFAKKQRLDDRGLPTPVIHPLRMYRKVLDAPSESWPVFPSFHRPTLSQRVTNELDNRGYTNMEIEEMRADRSLIEVCVEYDIEPPSITTDAGRHVLKRLCEEAGIELEELLQTYGDQIELVHVCDSTPTQDGLAFGEGDIDLVATARLLDRQFEGTVVLEVMPDHQRAALEAFAAAQSDELSRMVAVGD